MKVIKNIISNLVSAGFDNKHIHISVNVSLAVTWKSNVTLYIDTSTMSTAALYDDVLCVDRGILELCGNLHDGIIVIHAYDLYKLDEVLRNLVINYTSVFTN